MDARVASLEARLEKRDLVLHPQQYAFLQGETNGQIKAFVGPAVVNQTGQNRPVRSSKSWVGIVSTTVMITGTVMESAFRWPAVKEYGLSTSARSNVQESVEMTR